MTYDAVARLLRVQHALVYASIQGRTMRGLSLGLLDTRHVNFTVRHLIVALSRATHGKFLHIFNRAQEEACLDTAKKFEPPPPPTPAPKPCRDRQKYVDILGIKEDTLATIKAAYRKLAVQFHPDKNSNVDAPARFREIQEAYEQLIA